MPRWIYTRPPEQCHPTELRVAKKVNQLPDTWIVRWGFYYRDGEVIREGDFLVLGPDGGLLVLEVKTALRLCSSNGCWEGETDADSPKRQLDIEWDGVLNELHARCSGIPIPHVAKKLCIPGELIASQISTYYGIPREELLDQGELNHFAAHWKEWFAGHHRCSGADARAAFLKTYGAELREIRHFIKETDALLLRQLSLDYEVLDMLAENSQLLVRGGVGSGKTWMALEHAHRLAETGRNVLFLCYNLHLAALLKQIVAKRGTAHGSVTVFSWEELARQILESAGIPWAPPGPESDPAALQQFYTEEIPYLLRELVQSGDITPRFDALIVDEAQDHDTAFPESIGPANDGGWWSIYRALLHNGDSAPAGIYFDPAQRPVFRPATFSPVTLSDWAPHCTKVTLARTVRYTRQLIRFLQQLHSPATAELVAGLHPGATLHEGPDVQLETASPESGAEMVEKIISAWVRDGLCRPSEILILSRSSSTLQSGLLKGTGKIGDWSLAPAGEEGDIALSSFNRAKGLDSLAVIMIDTPPFEQLIPADQVSYWMAASRARQLLAVVQSGM